MRLRDPGGGRWALSLPLKINLLFGVLTLAMLGVLVASEISSTRSGVREEIEASNRIATQLLARVAAIYSRGGPGALTAFLRQTGRIRANEIRLYDHDGALLYESPPPSYKAGRYAPEWYSELVTPKVMATVIRVGAGTLVVAPNPSRAVLDGWDDLRSFALTQIVLLAFAYLLIFWLLTRWLAPFEQIRRGLLDIGSGDQAVRLPGLPGKESGELGRAFNRMAQAIQDDLQSRQETSEARARLAAQREFTRDLHRRIEEERNEIARELHDELGQSLTAIRSISAALLKHPEVQGRATESPIRLLFDTAGATFESMHRLIPRLRPIRLEEIGFVEAVRDLVGSVRQAHPELRIDLQVDAGMPAAGEAQETCAYRILQEALTNVVRHARAREVRIRLQREERGMRGGLRLTIADDGCGSVEAVEKPGRYGVRGMRERAESLGGSVAIRAAGAGGIEIDAFVPAEEAELT